MAGEKMTKPRSVRQLETLAYIDRHGGSITAAMFADVLAGQPRTIRAMFRDGLVASDEIPAKVICITPAGRQALAAHREGRK